MSFLCTTRPTSGKLQIMYKGVSRFPKARKHLHSYDGEIEQTQRCLSSQASFHRTQTICIHILQGPPVSCMTSPKRNLVLGRSSSNSGSCRPICINCLPVERSRTSSLAQPLDSTVQPVTFRTRSHARNRRGEVNIHLQRQLKSKGSVIHII